MPHQDYIVNGEAWPSATELTNLLPQAWLWSWFKSSVKKHGWRGWQKCKAQSKRGMAIGSEVHALIESFIQKTDEPTWTYKYESHQFADALFDMVNPLVDKWIEIEPHLKDDNLKIHGTADAIALMKDGTYVIIDWKTSAGKSETHPIQLAIYAMCSREKWPELYINTGMIARIDKKSKKLKVNLDIYNNLEQYYPVVEALRTIWAYSNGH